MLSYFQKSEIASLLIVCATLVSEPVWAQITPDTTLGAESSRLTPNAELRRADKQGQRADRIDGGARRGANLFHSFSEFNVNDGQRVYFANPDGVANILSRVTGTDVSDIDGTLGVDGSANLFFLNPNGIRFGPNARLDVLGSFMATTGDSFLFPDGFAFGATNPQAPPLLTMSTPVGVQYGGRIPGAIDISSGLIKLNSSNQLDYEGLDVLQGNSLLFLGGDINLTRGNLNAPGGRIELGGLAEAGTVGLQSNGQIFSLTFPSTSALSNVTLTEGARVAVRGNGGGSIAINANNLTASGGGRLESGTDGVGDSGDVQINVRDRASFDGRQIINGESTSSGVYNEVSKDAEGQGGSIFINTGSLSLTNGANLSTSTYGRGDAGDIVINARDRVSFDGGYVVDGEFFPSIALANVGEDPDKKFGDRQGGNIRITTGSLSLTNGSQLQTILYGNGSAGNIIINARDRVSFDDGYVVDDEFFPSAAFSEIQSSGSGRSGGIRINADKFTLSNGGSLRTSTFNQGDASDITLNVDIISLDRGDIFANVESSGKGDAGSIHITATFMSLKNGAQVHSNVRGQGNAGSIFVDAGQIGISGEGRDFNSPSDTALYPSGFFINVRENGQTQGQPGIVRITASLLTLRDGAEIYAATEPGGVGDAGNVDIDVKYINFMNDSNIFTSTGGRGNAGNVDIDARSIQFFNSNIYSDAKLGAEGDAGKIGINALDAIQLNHSSISVESKEDGRAGNLNVTTDRLTASDGSSVTVSSPDGLAGNLKITASAVVLDDSELAAETGRTLGRQGANINLQDLDLLLLRNGSRIFADANNSANGGNIAIDADLVVAAPSENSDIRANAVLGQGGEVDITSQGILGIQPALQPIPGISDITASSEQGVQGTITINTPNLDPSQGLIELPTTVVDASRQLAQTCPVDATAEEQGSFTRTGRSGLPSTPTDPLTSQEIASEWYTPTSETSTQTTATLPSDRPDPLIEAQGWVKYPDGSVEMVAAASTSDPPSPAFIPVSCHD